ncbi:MAG TPA: acyl-ACP--UDP-N-acetylglucosamine O-acyltransferase [Tepidisphaeraceae bacterium]|nr:acyl-ACP--UDP-N-acetylglucosamine O-acyltransferase [Tepidisphaeraceae bacterium]
MKNDSVKVKESKRSPWFHSLFTFRFFSDELPKRSPLAVIDSQAEIAEDVEIGPFCVIGAEVKIDSGCRLLNNVTVHGRTTIGKDNVFFPNSVIGAAPQDKKYKGSKTELVIGSRNIFREASTVHAGTETGGGITKIGDDGLYMVNAHVGHDSQIGDHVVFGNNVMIAGHVKCEDYAWLSGGAGVHHFVTLGRNSFVAGYARIHHDVPPFCKVDIAGRVRVLNKTGLERSLCFSAEDIAALSEATRNLFSKRKLFAVAMAEYEGADGINANVTQLIEFLRRRDAAPHGRHLEGLRIKPGTNTQASARVDATAATVLQTVEK